MPKRRYKKQPIKNYFFSCLALGLAALVSFFLFPWYLKGVSAVVAFFSFLVVWGSFDVAIEHWQDIPIDSPIQEKANNKSD